MEVSTFTRFVMVAKEWEEVKINIAFQVLTLDSILASFIHSFLVSITLKQDKSDSGVPL